MMYEDYCDDYDAYAAEMEAEMAARAEAEAAAAAEAEMQAQAEAMAAAEAEMEALAETEAAEAEEIYKNKYEFEYKAKTEYAEITQKIVIEAPSYEEAKRRFEKAKEFVEECEDDRVRLIEDWMLWEGWGHIGCERCALHGMYADCWGKVGCHGYYEGCGCTYCTRRDETE